MRVEKINGITIEFDEAKHKYYKDGEQVISVTGVTGIIDKSGALMGWVAKSMAQYLHENWDNYEKEVLIEKAKKEYRNISKDATDIGTAIHAWVSDWINGKKPEIPNDERIANGITAFLKWQKENKAKFIESEKLVYSAEHHYCGILDAVAKIGDKLVMVDFKSSNAIYPEMHLQTAGYQIAYEEAEGKNIDKRIIIRLGKDSGEFEVVEREGLRFEMADKEAFLSALNLKRWVNEN